MDTRAVSFAGIGSRYFGEITMNIRASSRAAFVIAAGLWICSSAPLYAADGDAQAAAPTAVGSAADTSAEPAKPVRHHAAKKTASKSRKADKHAATESKPATNETASTGDAAPDATNAGLSAAVANANAQWPTQAPADVTSPASQAGSFPTPTAAIQPEQPATAAPENGANIAQVVPADQLNDLDRAITDDKPPLTLAKATLDTPEPEVATSSSSNSPWDKTSLIGKIFVACGGLLTMASAARMFMA
jgi:hypothetical protein